MGVLETTLVQRLCGITITTEDLVTIAERFAAAAGAVSIRVDDVVYASIDGAVDAITEDVEVDTVSIASDLGDHTLEFTYRPRFILLQTISGGEVERRAFLAMATLLASRPLNGSPLCDIVTALPSPSPASRPWMLQRLMKMKLAPTSAVRRSPSESRRIHAAAPTPTGRPGP